MAAAQPGATALKVPRGRTPSGAIDYLSLNFAELLSETDAWCARLKGRGVGRGDRTLVMVKPGLPLIASVFALFKLGAVPVIIDPGMGLGSFLACVERSRPRALVGIPLAQVLSRACRRAFRSVKVRVPVSGSLTARMTGGAGAPADAASAEAGDLAAVLFTSGSTGAPKGVCYEHGMFEAQVGIIRETYGIEPGEVDLPLLPIFALFNPALGMTSVIPEMDPRRPASADPAKIVQAILQEGVTNSFGSPTLWRKVADYCRARDVRLPSLRRVLCAGAPVPADLWEASRSFLTGGRLHSPYGATEALPVSTVSADEIDPGSTRGACVGRPVRGVDVRIIAISDGPIAALAPAGELPDGTVGEIIVRGPVVTKEYDALPEATAGAKIADAATPGGVWHRMGDCGMHRRRRPSLVPRPQGRAGRDLGRSPVHGALRAGLPRTPAREAMRPDRSGQGARAGRGDPRPRRGGCSRSCGNASRPRTESSAHLRHQDLLLHEAPPGRCPPQRKDPQARSRQMGRRRTILPGRLIRIETRAQERERQHGKRRIPGARPCNGGDGIPWARGRRAAAFAGPPGRRCRADAGTRSGGARRPFHPRVARGRRGRPRGLPRDAGRVPRGREGGSLGEARGLLPDQRSGHPGRDRWVPDPRRAPADPHEHAQRRVQRP